jgi:hypothetical protein
VSVTFDFDSASAQDLVDACVDTFDFTLPGRDQSLGRDLAVRAAAGIADRSNRGLDADGQPFKPNEKRYAYRKLQRYGVDRPGELGGQMLSLTSLLGRPEVTRDAVVMRYGTGERPPANSRSGVPLRPWETKATDADKARHFTDSGRRFYELDGKIAASLQGLVNDAWEDHVRSVVP